jgi:trk system potassium uptake protein
MPIPHETREWEPTRATLDPWKGATERRRSLWRRLTPPQLFVFSFATLIAIGTLGLRFLPGLYTGTPLGWVDSLFTATSAVCVTGLVVVDTGTWFTPFGQGFLLLLIQAGGLGMITFTTMIILALGRRLSLRHESLTRIGPGEVAPHVDFERLTFDIVKFALVLEFIGAVVLYALWAPSLGLSGAVWPAIFHAISAFCNAGFSIFRGSLTGFQHESGTLAVMMLLIVAGGIGFLVLEEIAMWRRAMTRHQAGVRLSLHSRIVLWATGLLIAAGALAFGAFEWNNVLRDMDVIDRVSNALFMSITPRTAGFNTVDYGSTTASTDFLTILLMFIGGSPGSTAGGIKTTTFLLLGMLAWSRMRGTELVSIWGRSVPEGTVQRAVGLVVVAFTVVTVAIFTLTWTEQVGHHGEGHALFLSFMFEAVSAFNTVGLSLGVTDTLSETGRLLTTLLMFVGRVGPLTFAAALAMAARRSGGPYRYAYEDVVVG